MAGTVFVGKVTTKKRPDVFLFILLSIRPLLLLPARARSGHRHTGLPDFTRSRRAPRSVSNSAVVLLRPPGSHPAAGGARLADGVALGDELDADAALLRPPGHRSGTDAVASSETKDGTPARRCVRS